MPPRTRGAVRSELSTRTSPSTTPTNGASPIFSPRISPQDTPDTSEPEGEEESFSKRTIVTRTSERSSSTNLKKRQIEDEEQDIRATSKRRRNAVYVEDVAQTSKVITVFL